MDQPATRAVTRGAHHVGLTVADLDQASHFFIDTLGYTKVGDMPNYPAVALSDGCIMITLWQVTDSDNAPPFDGRKVVGLHHLALTVDGQAELDALYARLLQTDDVRIEFAPEPLRDGPTQHMMCYMPGGIRIEFIAPAV
jgi:catechol 2,3-dioxygenase-like lactoylglutathione lyase family enzyme